MSTCTPWSLGYDIVPSAETVSEGWVGVGPRLTLRGGLARWPSFGSRAKGPVNVSMLREREASPPNRSALLSLKGLTRPIVAYNVRLAATQLRSPRYRRGPTEYLSAAPHTIACRSVNDGNGTWSAAAIRRGQGSH